MNIYLNWNLWGKNVKVELDLSNYATEADLKKEFGVDISEFPKKTDLASLNVDVDESDICKLKTVPVDLSKLNNVVDNDVMKKTEFDKLLTKVNTTKALKSKYYNTGKSELKSKINNNDKKKNKRKNDSCGLAKDH